MSTGTPATALIISYHYDSAAGMCYSCIGSGFSSCRCVKNFKTTFLEDLKLVQLLVAVREWTVKLEDRCWISPEAANQ